ncbi:MAG: phenylacetate-CoA oxygenase subunit PaaC [Calditrichaeota bacterium]|nr:phenylacetate-CoA oxygenase subunit PaaC [Calditrichota bacterium]
MTKNGLIFNYLLGLADDRLILGQRLGEWCGHGPILEEDIAMTNIALDCFGQAKTLLELAANYDEEKREADGLAFLRDAADFKNLQLVELPNTDFAYTMVRQFLIDSFTTLFYEQLKSSALQELSDFAAKAIKEVTYHLRHSRNWLVTLGDGTDESHERTQAALDYLWPYTDEFFKTNEIETELIAQNIAVDTKSFKDKWLDNVKVAISEATLKLPGNHLYISAGGRNGNHTEHLGHILSDMQFLQRSYPGAQW